MHTRFDIYNIPFLAIIFILVANGVAAENVVFTALGYAWPWAVANPTLAKRYAEKSLRFSVLGLIFKLDRWLKTWPASKFFLWPYLSRDLPPLIFVLIIILIARQGNLLLAILGTLSFEGFAYLLRWRSKIGNNP